MTFDFNGLPYGLRGTKETKVWTVCSPGAQLTLNLSFRGLEVRRPRRAGVFPSFSMHHAALAAPATTTYILGSSQAVSPVDAL